MSNKIIKYGDEAITEVIKGIDAVANVVKYTVGPKGRNILIRENSNNPIITNDGVTIAKSIQLKDKIQDAGAQLIIQAANNTNNIAGDGTTTTTILAQAMINKYYELIKEKSSKEINPVQIQKEMIRTAGIVSNYLKSKALEVKEIEDIKRVATISSGSEDIGELLASAFELSGEFGSVIVEDSKTGLDSLRVTQGMKLTNGSINQFLLVDSRNRKTDLSDVNILIIKDRLESATDVLKILDDANNTGRKLLILCEDCENEIINTILMNKLRYGANLNISIVRIPGYGDLRDSIIEDICLATGATAIGKDYGINVKDYKPEYLGELDQMTITMEDTVIKFKDIHSITGNNLAKARTDRAQELIEQSEKADPENKQQFDRRISNLISGISILEIGGNSDIEIKDKKLRVEDAINSVQSAKEEGIVAGGGYSFLDAYKNSKEKNIDNTLGAQVVIDSLLAVTKQIAENAGYDGDEVVKNCLDKNIGFNALSEEYENLVETGIINSVKVDRYSLINATSVASTIITMGATIVNEPEKDQNVLQIAGTLPDIM